jgi:UDP:flavonoid glycosyltransferase YjiC (YdhE family)
LQAAGHTVKLFTDVNHKPFVEEMGLSICPCFSDIEAMMKEPLISAAMRSGNVQDFMKSFSTKIREVGETDVRDFYKGIKEFCPELVIAGTLSDYWGAMCKLRLKVPTLTVKLQALLPNPHRMVYGLPNLPCGLNGTLMKKCVLFKHWKAWADDLDPATEKLLGCKVCDVYTREQFVADCAGKNPMPYLVGQGQMLADILYPGAPAGVTFCGQITIPASVQQQYSCQGCSSFGGADAMHAIQVFIDSGSKPIYMGWGSMICKSPEYMAEMVTRALQQSGERAIIQGGWAKLSMDVLRAATSDKALLDYATKNVLFAASAPHEWLFPRCACTVHHGGAGTIGAALRASVPTVVTPVFLDQWDHAYMVQKLGCGVGFSKQFQKISAAELAKAIKQCVSDKDIAEKATWVGEKLRTEDGVGVVVQTVDKFWKEWVDTGKFEQHVDDLLKLKLPSA